MKRIEIAAYGAPEDVAHFVEAPTRRPGPGESCLTCSRFRSTRPICRSAVAAIASRPSSRPPPARNASAGSARSAPGSAASNPAISSSICSARTGRRPAASRRGCDPDPGRTGPAAGGDAAHQPADRDAAARRPCRVQQGDCVIQNVANSAVGRHLIVLAKARGVRTSMSSGATTWPGSCARSAPTRLSRTDPICPSERARLPAARDPARDRRDLG